MNAGHDPITDPRFDRFRPLSTALTRALVVVGVLSVLAVVLPERLANIAGAGVVVLLVAVPVLRVLWLVVRWFRRGDPRYALVGVAVLAVIAVGAGLALM